MLHYGLATLLLISTQCQALDYQFDISTNDVNYGWYANDTDQADFHREMIGIGLSAFDGNWGLRAGYMKGGEAHTQGRYSDFTVDMKYITSIEIIYRKQVSDNFRVFAGIGTYDIPVPIWCDDESYYRNDSDDDEGYFFGASVRLYNKWHLNYRYTKYSTNNSNGSDEWIEGNSIQLVYEL